MPCLAWRARDLDLTGRRPRPQGLCCSLQTNQTAIYISREICRSVGQSAARRFRQEESRFLLLPDPSMLLGRDGVGFDGKPFKSVTQARRHQNHSLEGATGRGRSRASSAAGLCHALRTYETSSGRVVEMSAPLTGCLRAPLCLVASEAGCRRSNGCWPRAAGSGQASTSRC